MRTRPLIHGNIYTHLGGVVPRSLQSSVNIPAHFIIKHFFTRITRGFVKFHWNIDFSLPTLFWEFIITFVIFASDITFVCLHLLDSRMNERNKCNITGIENSSNKVCKSANKSSVRWGNENSSELVCLICVLVLGLGLGLVGRTAAQTFLSQDGGLDGTCVGATSQYFWGVQRTGRRCDSRRVL